MKYLLTGKVYCGLCDRTLLSRPRYRRNERIRNYICPSPNHADRPGCGKIRIDADPLEEQVLGQIIANEWRLATEAEVAGADAGTIRESIEQDILSYQQTLSQFARDFADGLIDRQTYMETRQDISQQVEAGKRRLLGVAKGQTQTDWRQYLAESHDPIFPLSEAEFATWRQSIALMVDRVVIGPSTLKRGQFDSMRIAVEWRAS